MSWALIFRIRQYLKGSLWVLPALGGVAGVVLAGLDERLEHGIHLPEAWQYSADTASSVLTSIVAAAIGLLGFVVTISVLVVQMATGTLSPRFMRLWYRDRMQKIVLAALTATFAFAFGLLRRIQQDSVPSLGVTVAGVAVGGSVLLLLVYLEHFAHGLRPVAVAAKVAAAGRAVVLAIAEELPGTAAGPSPTTGKPLLTVRSRRSGVIQAVHHRELVRTAVRHDCVLALTHAVGDFVPPGATVVEVYGPRRAPGRRRLAAMVALGQERTIDQDPAFALRILVDIAIRGLSPAVNDPTTATQVLDYVEDLMQALGQADIPSPRQIRDRDGRVRVVLPSPAWEDYLSLAVTETRQYGATSPQVCRRLRAMLAELHDIVRPDRQSAVTAELTALDAIVQRSFTDAAERAFAAGADRQGIGGSTLPGPAPPA
ncbi:DUF2254 domain-containing protein [Actinoplanes sp. KI2]|uniref:DUF2254 domain-containing protein n=1 Tax=Actinoplanes sp. KI2 TaxID=2983315 RepID=UPI0021D5EC32|nr:DUF2254 domain-containing protein [Actinoplanes sp. KI2]MCU7730949.1 DUF2254 domain-containing protein [Actinoplanes sp. KI2]